MNAYLKLGAGFLLLSSAAWAQKTVESAPSHITATVSSDVDQVYGVTKNPLLTQAEELREGKKYDEARSILLQIAQESSSPTQVMVAKFRAAKCLFDKGDYATFKQESSDLFTQYPNADEFSILNTKLMLGKIPQRSKKHVEAVAELEDVANSNPNLIFAAQALAVQGDELRRLNRYDEARAKFDRILTVKHTPLMEIQAKHQSVACLFSKGDFDAFEHEAKTLLEENPPADDNVVQTTKFHLAHLAAKRGNSRETAEQLETFIAANPTFRQITLANHRAGQFYMKAADQLTNEGNTTESAVCFQKGKDILDPLRAKLEGEIAADPKKAVALNVRYLILDCFVYEHDYAGLAAAAEKMTKEFQPPSKNWAAATVWMGIGKARMDPPDRAGAAAAFDAVIAENVVDDNLSDHIPTQAVAWRAWVAKNQNDGPALKAALSKISELPDGPVKKHVLEQYAAEIKAASES